MKLSELIFELQSMYDSYGESDVEVADSNDVLDSYLIDRICFFKSGEEQRVIIVES